MLCALSAFLLHKTRDTPSRVNREVSKSFDYELLTHLLKRGKNRDEEKKREKDSRIDDWQKKRECIFSAKGVAKNVGGCKAAKKKEVGKDLSKVEVPVIFVKGNYSGTPLCTMCRINEGGDKERL